MKRNHSHNMQDTNQSRQAKEPRIRLQQHPLNLIQLCPSTTLLLCGLIKPMGHTRKHLKFHERHGLENDLQREGRCTGVYFDVVRSQVPKFIGEDDWLIESLGAGFVAFIGDEVDVWNVV